MQTTSLTNLELIGLQTITYSDFYENGRKSVVWDYSVYDICPFTGKTRSGVFSSLVQKGMINVYEGEKKYIINENGQKVINKYWDRDGLNFGTIEITELGYQTLDNLGLINENGNFINHISYEK